MAQLMGTNMFETGLGGACIVKKLQFCYRFMTELVNKKCTYFFIFSEASKPRPLRAIRIYLFTKNPIVKHKKVYIKK